MFQHRKSMPCIAISAFIRNDVQGIKPNPNEKNYFKLFNGMIKEIIQTSIKCS